ncbi:MAG: SDR family NAD(P)-dependent oxidoreductase [Alphaproteobacteria bacterium]|jgi:NAD(P)-dependent dehydrogenase (short-subunit alcohol dehydrogenase family)|nr:SDR family NAD(P)-dependent oxidoreductase [Alphaproteobacteria bacterium]MDP6566304.1 SDR family NAD(P)-dependent oxidoreductase [Alphaproteobacteria bacterium]MDP6814474.1 SDR family NAD(P)-dependent oxidoreductase [Alphaproteobacteria bacterium]
MSIRFDDRVAVITGAGNGLGRSHALFLASRGARVVVNDLGGAIDGTGADVGPAQAVADEIAAAGGEAVANTDDIAGEDGAKALVGTALERWGRCDIVINNAGILRDKSFHNMDLDDFKAVVKVHMLGSVRVTHEAWPAMREQQYGRVLMTTSAAGLYGNFGQTNYATAKMAVIGLMNALKQEGRKYNITVNTLAPIAGTRMGGTIFPDEVMPLLRPELVTPAVAYLVSEQCTDSGRIIAAGAGHYAAVAMVEGAGVDFDATTEVSPEMLAEAWAGITDLSAAAPYDEAMAAVQRIFANLSPGGGG